MEFDGKKYKFFGEFYPFKDDVEKEEAKQYLLCWKKNLLNKLQRDSFHCEIKDEQWGERPAHLDGCMNQKSYMYLKICLEAVWDYELK